MAVDKNKVTAEATRLVQKGHFDKAIKAYEKVLAEDPKDVRVLLKVGELQQKKGDNPAAAATFGRVADAYGEQGFFLKAVAVYKQMLKLAPDDVRVNERLAGLYQQLGILSDAMAQLQIVAAACERAGDHAKQLDALRRMVELEPDDIGPAVKLGELYARQNQPKLALEQLRRAAEQLRRLGRADEYLKVAERISFLAPEDLALTRELAHLHLARGDTKRALAKLQLCFKADPKDLETLNLLAQAFKDLGQVQKTISVYKEVAHLQAERGRGAEARATWRRVLELSPHDPEALQAIGAPTPVPAPVSRRPAPGVTSAPATPSPPARPAPPSAPRRPPIAPAPSAIGPAATGPSGAGPQAISKLLTETDVYLKYGLHEKALEHLQKVFAIDPDQLDARERALRVRAARGDVAGAADEAARVAQLALARGLGDRARAALASLRELAPSHPAVAALEAGRVGAAEETVAVDTGDELLLEVEPPTAPSGGDELALVAAGAVSDEVVEEEPIAIDDEAVMLEGEPVAARAPAVPPAASAPAPAPAARAAPPLRLVPPPPPVAARPAPLRAAPQEGIKEELQELDFFLEQDLRDEAREALQRLLRTHPQDPRLLQRRAALERRSAPAPAPAPQVRRPTPPVAAPPAPAVESFDIGRELAEELGPQPSGTPEDFQYSVEDVFDQFKKAVAQSVGAEDSDTHYDLGIAYKEMGLLDDALHEFEVALAGNGRKKEIDCLTMIGICRLEKGEPGAAVEAYQRALRSGGLTPEAARAIHYELAGALEASGDRASALQSIQKVLKADPGYRDAKAIAARLTAAPVPPGPKKNIGYV